MIRKYQNTIFRALVIALLIILQLLFVAMLPRWVKMNSVFVYFLIEVCSVFLMFSLVADNANSAYRIFWLGVVLLLPITGHVMYELWGKEGGKKRQHEMIQKTIDFYNGKIYFSQFLYECGVWFCQSDVREEVRKDYFETLEQCREVTLEEWEKRSWKIKCRQMILQSFKSQF